jgi:hypothetical protein
MKIAATLLLALSSAAPAAAWNEPDSFLGVKWGDSPDTAREVMGKRDGDVRCESGRYGHCVGETTIGDVRIILAMTFDDSSRFAGAIGSFASRSYRDVRAMFVEKYGPPTKTETGKVTNRLGAALTSETLRWVGKNIVIELPQHGVNVTEGTFSVFTKAELEAMAAREKASIRKGAKGL